MKKVLFALVAALLFPLAASAQTQPGVIPGFMAPAGTDGCPANRACFVPYSATYPLPVTGGGGGGGDVTVTAPLGRAADAASVSTALSTEDYAAITGAVPAGTNIIGATNGGNTGGCGSVIPISQTTSTDLHTASGKTYICSIVLVIADAESIALIEGTGSTCGTGGAALIGSTTVGSGIALAANGGFSAVAGIPQLPMQTASDHLCLLQSGSGRLAGYITYNDH